MAMTAFLLLLLLAAGVPNRPVDRESGDADVAAPDECQSLPRPRMRVRLTFTTAAPVRERADAITSMVGRTWQAEGMAILWAPPTGRGPGTWHDIDLWVVVRDGAIHHAGADALGAVSFVDGVPQRMIVVSTDRAIAWVHAAEAARLGVRKLPFPTMPLGESRELVSDAVAYAVAHEIGHFALSTRDHAADGLMRSTVFHPHALRDAGAMSLDAVGRALLAPRLRRGASCP